MSFEESHPELAAQLVDRGLGKVLSFGSNKRVEWECSRGHRWSATLNWQPRKWLRLSAAHTVDGRAVPPELVAAPSVTTANVPYFDPLTGQTVLVTAIYGGAANLDNEKQRIDRVSLSLSPWAKYNALINVDYTDAVIRNQIGGLPLPTAAVVTAFPDRFVRDTAGQLILVDNRTVNFDRQAYF